MNQHLPDMGVGLDAGTRSKKLSTIEEEIKELAVKLSNSITQDLRVWNNNSTVWADSKFNVMRHPKNKMV